MENINYGTLVGEGSRETAQRTAAGVLGAATAATVGELAVAAGCGSVLCTVGAPVAAGVAVAAGTAAAVGWLWDSLFG